MPLQNRVTPEGDIIATPHRGLLMGNRGGAFHSQGQALGARRWASKAWIACVLDFKGRHREVMQPNRYTELFFLDEATALSAGHRPCFECRRKDAEQFAALWARAHGAQDRARAPHMDEALHAERTGRGGAKPTFRARLADLPTGTVLRYPADGIGTRPHLVIANHLLAWSPGGYSSMIVHSSVAQELDVLTPRSIVAVLAAGYRPMLHPSATALLARSA
jgi:hypothetical protein